MVIKELKEFLDRFNIKYVTMTHSRAYTAQEVAAAAHIPVNEIAKSVMVKLDGKMAMAVIPASNRVDLSAFALRIGATQAVLATESEFKDIFKGCEIGAMPPFGNLWKLPVYVSRTLAEDERIAFNAGTHTDVMTLAFDDYRRLVEPQVLDFTIIS